MWRFSMVWLVPPHPPRQVLDRLPWFFSHTTGVGASKKTTYGSSAAPSYLAALTAKKSNEELAFDDLHQAHIFAFMFDSAQNDEIADLTTHLMQGVSVGSKRRKAQAASSSRAAPPQVDKRRRKKGPDAAEDDHDKVMALFG